MPVPELWDPAAGGQPGRVIVIVSVAVLVIQNRSRPEVFVPRKVQEPFPSASSSHRPAPWARRQTIFDPWASQVVG